jgi:DNA-binding response OmpR family regulator
MQRPTILTVEDDPAIRRGIVDALTFAGYEVVEAGDGNAGMEIATTRTFDLLLLDVVMRGHSGFDILKAVREQGATCGVIMLTAKGDEADRVTGLQHGADDYVVKPFSVKELLARVEAVLRRAPERPRDVQKISLPWADVDLPRLEIRFHDGTRADLSEKEAELLRYLAANPNRAITRDELLQRVWQINPRGLETRTVDMHVTRLREKLRDDSSQPKVVLTVRGKGYMFAMPDVT